MKRSVVRALAALALVVSLTPPAQAASPFWVVNRSSSEIESVIVFSSKGESNDLLGRNGAIEPGDQVLVLRSPGSRCVVDVRIITNDGQAGYFPNFNACSGTLYVRDKALEQMD